MLNYYYHHHSSSSSNYYRCRGRNCPSVPRLRGRPRQLPGRRKPTAQRLRPEQLYHVILHHHIISYYIVSYYITLYSVMREQQRGTVSSNSRSQTVLFQQCSANLSYSDHSALPVSVDKNTPFYTSLGHATQRQNLLSGPCFGAPKAHLNKGLRLRSVYYDIT